MPRDSADRNHTPPGSSSPPGSAFFRLFPSIMLPMFLSIVDQTIVSSALPAIGGALGGVEHLTWIVVGYLVANTIAAPVYGRLGDAFGRVRLMLFALGLFVAASLLCALATSVEMLAVLRILQGLGGGGLMTLSQALVGEAVPPRERAKYQGYLAAVAVTSSTFGPVAGGFLTEHFGWRSIFLMNLPLGALAALLVLRLPPSQGSGRVRFDQVGLVLFVLFVVPLLLALQQAQRFEWQVLPWIAGLLAVSGIALVLLIRQEKRVSAPLLPVQLLRQPAIWRCDAMAACHGAALVSLLTFLPMYFRVVRGASPAEIGLLLVPMAIAIGVGSMLTGQLMSRTGRTAIFPSWGMPMAAVTMVGLALFAPRFGTQALSWGFGFLTLCMGTVMGVVQVTVQGAAGPGMLGAAAGSVQFSRSVGAAFGTAVVGALLFAVLVAADSNTAALFTELIRRGPAAIAGLPPPAQAAVQAEVARAFTVAFLAVAGFLAAGASLAWSLPVRRLGE